MRIGPVLGAGGVLGGAWLVGDRHARTTSTAGSRKAPVTSSEP